MEQNINIAEILKDKLQGTKLHDLLCNVDVELDTIGTTDKETVVWCTNETNNNTTCHRGYSEFGTERGYPDGLQILLPSKEMRDWERFAWKKGDVLNSSNYLVIFDRWCNDDYTSFIAAFGYNQNIEWGRDGEFYTSKFNKVSDDEAKEFIKEIEKNYGGKLNLETLKIEKQPEFKDGDIVALMVRKCTHIAIFQSRQGAYIGFHAVLCQNELLLEKPFREDDGDIELRPATDSEKQQLFEALAKKNKAWDTEKKQIVDLPKKCEFQPFQKVLTRDTLDEKWVPNLFSNYNREYSEYMYGCISGGFDATYSKYCIPYNEDTKHLLGTTDKWKGGEG